MKTHRTACLAIVLSDIPTKVLERDPYRKILRIQNQEATATSYIRYGGDGVQRSYLRYDPSMNELLDQYAPTEEIWAYSNIPGAILTVMMVSDRDA